MIDLRIRFELLPREITESSRVIAAFTGRTGVGMIVEGVSEVLTISGGGRWQQR